MTYSLLIEVLDGTEAKSEFGRGDDKDRGLLVAEGTLRGYCIT
jgi:hypothetical protein